MPDITLLTDRRLGDYSHLEFLRLNLPNRLVEVATCLFDAPRVVCKDHERVLFSRLGCPVKQQSIHPPLVAPLQNVSISAKLPLISSDQFGAVLWPRRSLEVKKFQPTVPTEEQVYLACQDVTVLLQRNIHFGLDHSPHFLLILTVIVQYLPKC